MRNSALILFDLDHFRMINTALEKAGGDRVLVEVARRIEGLAPNGARIARTGADEFAVLVSLIEAFDCQQFAHELSREIARPIDAGTEQLAVSIAIGIAEAEVGESLDDLVRRAGGAIRHCRGPVRSSSSVKPVASPDLLRQRFTLERELRAGLKFGQLSLYYQPIVDLQTLRTAEFEALLRWEHPERGTLLPADFLFALGSDKLIRDIGRWVLTEACRQGSEWQDANPAWPITIAVNLAPSQIADPRLADDVRMILAETGFRAGSLRLEISESITLAEIDDAVQLIGELRDLGVRLALDDFGAGNAGWTLLRQSQIDTIKLDQSFISGEDALGADRVRMVEALTGFATQLGMIVSIEGVERADQALAMRAIGVHQAQGFYFALPQPASAMVPLLLNHPVQPTP